MLRYVLYSYMARKKRCWARQKWGGVTFFLRENCKFEEQFFTRGSKILDLRLIDKSSQYQAVFYELNIYDAIFRVPS